MAIPIQKFGQYVLLQVHNEQGVQVFATDSLKVDFDVRNIPNWSRAKIDLTNLAPATIRKLSESQNGNYVTLFTSLHDSPLSKIVDRMFISNAIEEVKVPESITSLYCYSKSRKLFLEKQIDIKVTTPTIHNTVEKILQAGGFTGQIEFKFFPPELLQYRPPKPSTRQQGSVVDLLTKLGLEFGFNYYTIGNKMVFMYKPNVNNVVATSFYSGEGDIKLSTTNMRSNPKIGPATLSVVSNLDPRIEPSTVLDIANLLTVGTNTSTETLQVAENYLREKVAGFSKYQTLSVQHKGSNWTGQWITQAVGTSPTPGTTMPSERWWI